MNQLRNFWNTSAWFHGVFIMSMALWGILGSLTGGIPTKYIGRKKDTYLDSFTLLGQRSWLWISNKSLHVLIFRFLGGIGVGASTVAAPIYISEISTAKRRGQLVALYQFNIVFGIFLAFVSNYLLSGIGGINDWRWMLGIEAFPAALYCLLILEYLNLRVGY